MDERAWHDAEVDALYRIHAAGVRVPKPFAFVDGVLVMELIQGHDGEPAPRLADLSLSRAEAKAIFDLLLREVVRMLCAGLVHADLSDFNVLLGVDGPVLIDFPQCVDPAHNNNARRLLIRDVDNLTRILGRFAPELRRMRYGQEMWEIYEAGDLTPDTPLTGKRRRQTHKADTDALLAEIEELEREARERREALGLAPSRPPRRPVPVAEEPPPRQEPAPPAKRRRRRRRGGGASSQGAAAAPPVKRRR
jgi:RIO kinase 1